MLGSRKTKEIELTETPAGSLELAGVLLLRNLSGKAFLCANAVVLCASVVELLNKTLTTETQRSHREPQRRILRQTPKHEPPTVLPANARGTHQLSFTRRSYIFLRNTAIAPLVLVSSMDLELSTQADSMRYIE